MSLATLRLGASPSIVPGVSSPVGRAYTSQPAKGSGLEDGDSAIRTGSAWGQPAKELGTSVTVIQNRSWFPPAMSPS